MVDLYDRVRVLERENAELHSLILDLEKRLRQVQVRRQQQMMKNWKRKQTLNIKSEFKSRTHYKLLCIRLF